MSTEEEKELIELLTENLDDDDLSVTYTPAAEEIPQSESRSTRRKNRRWRQLDLKIKFFCGVILLGAALTAGVLYNKVQHRNEETNVSSNAQSTSASTQSTSKTTGNNLTSAPDKADPRRESNDPAASGTPAPVTPTPAATPTPAPTPTPTLPDDWNLILVNPWNPVPEGFTVELQDIENGHSVDARIARYLERMLADARAQGLSPMICSSYRTMEKQQELYTNKVQEYLSQGYSQTDAEAEAGKWVAVPGTSEHQTGLAVDIVSSTYQILDQKQEETAEQKWLMENSYKYGFILRYPNDKREITGIYYEPWHYRYVGYRTAKEIHEKGICYEEYLDSLK